MHHHSDHCHHHSAPKSEAKQMQLTIALVLVFAFAVVELLVGLSSHSLALVAESGHMATDSLALVLALAATWLQALKPDLAGNRWETGAALINGVALLAIAPWIGWQAIAHLLAPPQDISSLPMLLTACAGAVVNGVNVALLHRGSDHDLNLKAAFLHVVADTLSSIGVIVAAIAIATRHWFWADGAISLVVAGLIAVSATPLVWESAKILLQQRVQA